MKCIIYSVCSFLDPHIAVLLERAKRMDAEGYKVTFAYCAGCMDVCGCNVQGSPITCYYCRMIYKQMLHNLPKSIKVLPVGKPPTCDRDWTFSTLNEFKKLQYKSVFVGYAALSTYISVTRNSRPNLSDDRTRNYLTHLLNLQADMSDWFLNLLDVEKYDMVRVHTGRMAENRLFYDISMDKGVHFVSDEYVGSYRGRSDLAPIEYDNSLPHGLAINNAMAEKLWKDAPIGQDEKIKIASNFFVKRRNNEIAGDRVYTGAQQNGLLPEGFNRDKCNIVVFNSSEDEFSSLGKEFEDYQLFSSQTAGIVYLLENLPATEYHVYVRVHPNLTRVKYDYVVELFDLPRKYPNITIIPPASPVSTYSLMDVADKVVVFGSTAGAEASYLGKPVILLGPSFYYYLDVAYTPQTPNEAIHFLKMPDLPRKPKENALKFSFFLLRRDLLATPTKYYDFRLSYPRFLGREFVVVRYSKLFGSCLLKKLVSIFFQHGVRKFGKWPLGDAFFHDPVSTRSTK